MAHAEVPVGFAQEMGEVDGGMTFQESMHQISGQKLLGPHSAPIKTDRPLGEVGIGDLPLRMINPHGSKIVAFCDILMDQTCTWDLDKVHQQVSQGRYSDLPEPLRLKKEPIVPYTMQLFVLPAADGKYNVVKHINLHKNRLDVKLCMTMCYGQGMQIDYGKHFRDGFTAFQFMLEKLGGFQLRFWPVQPKFTKKIVLEASQRSEGYNFIRECGPRSNNVNQFMEWTDEQVNNASAPIHGWQEGKVKEALNNYYKGRQNAKSLTFWPLTLKCLVHWFLNIVLKTMLGTIRQHGITWLGKTRVGKSLGSKTILFAQSKYEIECENRADLIPSIMTAKHLDFFKAEPLTKYKPGGFDDGMMQKQDASFLKAFLNPGEEDATVWARYSSAQFDMGAGRHACNNPYDKDLDEQQYVQMKRTGVFEVTFANFMNLIQPSFAAIDDKEDMLAILARTHVILISDNGVYHRVAGTTQDPVKFIEWPTDAPKDILTVEYKPVFQKYKKDPFQHIYPDNFDEDSVWSQALLHKLINGEPLPHTISVRTTNLFGDGHSTTIQAVPNLLPNAEMKYRVKVEKTKSAWRALRSQPPVFIDLDAPSPKRLRSEAHPSSSATSSGAAPLVTLLTHNASSSSSSPPLVTLLTHNANPSFAGLGGDDSDFEQVFDEEDVFGLGGGVNGEDNHVLPEAVGP
ncbi:unnamed protein product [Polarella glacialis]|uniref:Uncharacterized protein n=1 Tax=Polarella glacialis TaxID=89957 RepID=A0A813E790_POLGL|nr:unnamed protein product [Polarella glacialis]